MSKRYGTVEERFWRHVNPEPSSGCWLWDGPVDDFGYGRFRVGAKKPRVHVLCYEWHKGRVPDGLIVRHRCDMPGCVNPDHLICGTLLDNIRDRVERKRSAVGRMSPSAKLDEEKIREIRASEVGPRALGRRYGVSHSIIRRIQAREDWAHVA